MAIILHRPFETFFVALRVPFHLRRRDKPLSVNGLLIESRDPEALLTVCAHLQDPLIFLVAGGYFVVADAFPRSGLCGVRLRRLSENCYLPADADLVPSLTSAETVDLTQTQGLVFRPCLRDPLAFDPGCPLRPSAFLAVRRPARENWEPFPRGKPTADTLNSITRLIEIPPIEEMLGGDGSGIGTEEERPPAVGPGRRAIGNVSAQLGKGLGAIGKAIGSKKLSGLGNKLKGLGAKLSPRVSEELLGKQEAALQHLLKKFREGKTDDALRHSIPIGEKETRGRQIYNSARLPRHGLSWSLGSLFGGGGGHGSVWAGGNPDTWRDLLAEYHKAAREAADRGDFRRAALIYAKLLNDFRAAGEVLARGGLHRDAGIVFRDKVKDPARAAREFEKAGEFDEALRLYRENHQFEESGDLLRRMGEEEKAIDEYHRAAQRVVDTRQDYVAAGEILLKKTGRADLAGAYFARGWQSRSQALGFARNAMPCAERLMEIYAFAEPRDPFWQLLGEAETWLGEPGWSHDASRFFNKVCGLAELPHLQSDRGEIRDRCRLGLSGKLRQSSITEANVGTTVSDLFSSGKRWSPAVVSDADFALRAAIKARPKTSPRPSRPQTTQNLRAGDVTAIIQVAASGDLIVGFRDGAVVRFSPLTSKTVVMAADESPVIGLAIDELGTTFVVLHAGLPCDGTSLHSHPCQIWQMVAGAWLEASNTRIVSAPGSIGGLLPLLEGYYGVVSLGVNTADGLAWYALPDLLPRVESGASSPLAPTTYLRLRVPDAGDSHTLGFQFQGGSVSWGGQRVFVGWMPDPVPGCTLFSPPVSWLIASPTHVELAGLFDSGVLYWTEIDRKTDQLLHRTLAFRVPNGFRAVACLSAGIVAVVASTNRVFWLRVRSGQFEEFTPSVQITGSSHAAAAFACRQTNELLVILEDGTLVRLPVPR